MAARQIRVSGQVQGVGYRASLRDEARKHGVRGWVRNRADGTVEALLQGPDVAIAAVIAWARSGPPGARVASLAEAAAEPEPQVSSFELRPTLQRARRAPLR